MSNVRKSGTFPLSLYAKARLFLYHFVLSRLFNLIVRAKRDQARWLHGCRIKCTHDHTKACYLEKALIKSTATNK